MILEIDTSEYNKISLRIVDGDQVYAITNNADKSQSEKLLPMIDRFITDNDYTKESLEKIRVESAGSSFTSLRIGVITANTLAYALDITVEPFVSGVKSVAGINLVEPKYDREPNIT